jgi:hypothetical protein
MSVRRIRTDATGSATIAAANNTPTGQNTSANVSTTVLTIAEFTTWADQFNSLLAACKAHGIVNSA